MKTIKSPILEDRDGKLSISLEKWLPYDLEKVFTNIKFWNN